MLWDVSVDTLEETERKLGQAYAQWKTLRGDAFATRPAAMERSTWCTLDENADLIQARVESLLPLLLQTDVRDAELISRAKPLQ